MVKDKQQHFKKISGDRLKHIKEDGNVEYHYKKKNVLGAWTYVYVIFKSRVQRQTLSNLKVPAGDDLQKQQIVSIHSCLLHKGWRRKKLKT